MPVDIMTHSDVLEGNAAQFKLLRSGTLRLVSEEQSLSERKACPKSRCRSRAASSRYLERTQQKSSDEAVSRVSEA
eukprot:2082918-Pyramimonas_sp.AAC.1